MPYISTETEIKLLERDANERLIAAAPDLLAVVEKLLAVPANQIGDVLMLIPSARAAIAKATGKE
ncbi:MAG: hypothetical protein EBZ49_03715 [Proteobacteria bacterium]|nr:hypothetical protein [Pseudomonadota bacterium]